MVPDINFLIIDSDEAVRKGIEILLRQEGYKVWTVASGQEALDLANKINFHIVVTDLNMPGMSGIEILEKLRQKSDNICFVVSTAFPSVKSAVEAMRQGAYDYIAKPFNSEEIKIILRRAAERQVLLREAGQKEYYRG